MYWADKHAALPCRNSKLFHVAEKLGYEFELNGLDGEEVARIYNKYVEDSNNEPDCDELKTYAKDGLISMKHVYGKIKEHPYYMIKKGSKRNIGKDEKNKKTSSSLFSDLKSYIWPVCYYTFYLFLDQFFHQITIIDCPYVNI